MIWPHWFHILLRQPSLLKGAPVCPVDAACGAPAWALWAPEVAAPADSVGSESGGGSLLQLITVCSPAFKQDWILVMCPWVWPPLVVYFFTAGWDLLAQNSTVAKPNILRIQLL